MGSEDVWPDRVFRVWGSGNNPEAGLGMMHQGDGFSLCGGDRIGGAKEVDGEVGIEAPLEVEGEVQIEQGGIGRRLQAGAFLRQSLGPGGIGGQAGGAADMGGVVVVDLLSEQKVGVGVAGDMRMSEERDEPVLKITEATLDLSFGLSVGSDAMCHSQGSEGALELRAGIQAVTGETWPKRLNPSV